MPAVNDDPNLAEVKAVLKRLQRLDLSSELSAESRIVSGRDVRAARPNGLRPGVGVFDKKRAAIDALPKKLLRTPIALAAVGVTLVCLAGLLYFLGTGQSGTAQDLAIRDGRKVTPSASGAIDRPAVQASTTKEVESKVLLETRKLLNEGDIVGARQGLLRAKPEELPEIAFVLAQSYDPNYLRTLSKTNAEANRTEAERWYRQWYQLAQGSGLEMDSSRLQRIINAMR